MTDITANVERQITMRKRGMTLQSIADECGISRQAVSQACKRFPTGKSYGFSGPNSVKYDGVRNWLNKNHCSINKLETMANCGCIRHSLMVGNIKPKKAEAIMMVTGMSREEAFGKYGGA